MRRKPTILESISCILIMALIVGVGNVYLKLPIQPLLLISATYAAFIAYRVGLRWEDIEEAISDSIGKCMPAILIIFSVGIVVGTWIYAGTVPMLIYYGLKIITPQMFLVCAFVIVAIVSMATGTAWGSTATAGVALIGMAESLGVPLPIAAGAIISGGVFGDKLSPLSDTTNLAPLVTGVDLFDHIKHMLYTTLPSAAIGMIVYLIVGLRLDGSGFSSESIASLLSSLDSIYNWNILMLLPIVIIIIGALTKKPTVPMMLLSSVAAIFIGNISHGFNFADGFKAVVNGFDISMVTAEGFNIANCSEQVIKLVSRGGLMSMTSIVVMIFCGYSFAAIVEKAGCLEVIVSVARGKIKKVWQLTVVAVIGSTILVFATGVASVPILMMGTLLKDIYINMDLHPKNLSRTLEDAGTMLIPFIPWGASGIFYLDVLGVGPLEFGIWAIPCYLGIVFAIIYGATGFGIEKLSDSLDKTDFESQIESV
ncbi:Na+/H+ antiporter NhaC [Clostridioides difficile]